MSERYSDSFLLDYLNDRVDPSDLAKFEAALTQDIDLEKRLMSLDPLATPVKGTLENLELNDRLSTLSYGFESPPKSQFWRNTVMLGLSAAAGIVVTFGFVQFQSPTTNDWRAEVAAYQALYVPETVADIENSPTEIQTQLGKAETAVGLSLEVATLDVLDSAFLKRTQVLGFETRPLIQVAYRTLDGTPVAFCIISKTRPSDAEKVEFSVRKGLASASWSNETHAFLLIGGNDLSRISVWANQLAHFY